jgi:hypothetical protein
MHERIAREGVNLLRYCCGGTYWLSVPADLAIASSALSQARIERITAEEKIAASLLETPSMIRVETGRIQRALVEFHADVPAEQIDRALTDLGVEARHYTDAIRAVVADGEQIRRLAERDEVASIWPGPLAFVAASNLARASANTEGIQGLSGPTYTGTTGEGARIGICDEPLAETHPDLSGRVLPPADARHAIHGTIVASIAAGGGNQTYAWVPSLGPLGLRGHAPRASIGEYATIAVLQSGLPDLLTSCHADTSRYHEAIISHGMDVTNHSYHQTESRYSSDSAAIDGIVRGDATHLGVSIPARPQVWAAGNTGIRVDASGLGTEEGYFSVHATAKNPITVGSWDTVDRPSVMSSLGPTYDGRTKPDVVAPGCHHSLAHYRQALGITATFPTVPNGVGSGFPVFAANDVPAQPGVQAGYHAMCATSAAAPVVSGILALMLERYRGLGATAHPLPSTYKAILVQTARDRVWQPSLLEPNNADTGQPISVPQGPDFVSGFGLVDGGAAVGLIADGARWKEAVLATSGTKHLWCTSASPGDEEMRASVAWDDEPGFAGGALGQQRMPQLVNDLDLELVGPGGAVFLPWTPTPPSNGPGGPLSQADFTDAPRAVDRLNNVEMASVADPDAGTWKIRITAHALPLGRSQRYSLAASRPIWRCWPRIGATPPPCVRHPWICKGGGLLPRRLPEKLVLSAGPTRLQDLCRYADECPRCDGHPWKPCEAWHLELEPFPSSAQVLLIDEQGEIRATSRPIPSGTTLEIPAARPGEDFVLAIADAAGEPHPELEIARIRARSAQGGSSPHRQER